MPPQSPSTYQNSFSVTKKCVGAQTNDLDNNVIAEENEDEEEEQNDCSSNVKCRQLKGPLADSPDEGYVGDSQESTDIWQQGYHNKTLEAILQTEDVVVL